MKKHFILSLMAAVLVALNVNAQEENTYSMVITLANGTSITIGPNEVSNISFNDGEVTVSGAKIEEMVQNIAKNSKMIEDNTMNIYNMMSIIADNRRTILDKAEILDSDNNYITHYGYNSETGSWGDIPWTIKGVLNNLVELQNQIHELQEDNYRCRNQITELQEQVMKLGGHINNW